MKVLLLLTVTACNSIFGLPDVLRVDARIEIDAPTTCPGTGTVPGYARTPTQVLAQECSSYQRTTSGDLAIASCIVGISYGSVEGPADGPLDRPSLPGNTYGQRRLDPAGGTLYAISTTAPIEVLAFRRDGTGWTVDAKLPFVYPTMALSTVARIGDAVHLIVVDSSVLPNEIHEWVGVGGTWNEQGPSTTPAGLGVLGFDSWIDLSPDGLRMVVQAVLPNETDTAMYYLDRSSPTGSFGTPQRIDLPRVSDPFITDDCTRVYYSGLDRVFYNPRI